MILTNFHVVGSAVTVQEEWNPKVQKEVKRERRESIEVSWHQYNDLSAFVGTSGKTALGLELRSGSRDPRDDLLPLLVRLNDAVVQRANRPARGPPFFPPPVSLLLSLRRH